MTSRIRHRSNVGFARVRCVIPTFQVNASFTDVDLANDYDFQIGIETTYTNALTGIPARLPFLFNGSNIASYRSASGPYGYILSDWLVLPTPIAAGAFFGIWTTVEQPAQLSNVLVNNGRASNYFQKYEGRNFTASSQIGANYALNSTSIAGAYSATQAGDATYPYFGPAFLIIDYPVTAKVPMITGDSLGDGLTGEGGSGSSTAGSGGQGSQFNNAGYAARGIDETLGINYAAKIAMPGDTYSKLSTLDNWKYRRQLMALANPTHDFCSLGTNDVATGTGLGQIVLWAKARNDVVHSLIPGIKIVSPTIIPRTNSTDSWATLANQTDYTGFTTGKAQSINNDYIRAMSAAWGHDACLDLSSVTEDGLNSNRWLSGSAFLATPDGIHPNSARDAVMATSFTGGLFA